MRLLIHYKMRQKFITKCIRFFITKYDSITTKYDSITTKYDSITTKCIDFITNCDSFYKMRRLLRNASIRLAVATWLIICTVIFKLLD